jgi:transcriptional regulator GlxA family with amidase domain
MHRIAVLVAPPVSTFDMSVPELAFGPVRAGGAPAYEVRVCAADPGIVAGLGGVELVIRHGLEAVAAADTVIVSGPGDGAPPDPRLLAALRRAAGAGTRLASVCTGTFLLADAGLLDGREATTHWMFAAELARRHPRVRVRSDVLYVADGVWTSAGHAGGADLCLHLIRTDHGAAAANEAARRIVAGPIRDGDQKQRFDAPLPPGRGTSLTATRAWVLEHLREPLTLAGLAAHAGVSTRTLTRRFRAETGLSPLRWILRQRVERARELLETTDLTVEQVARHSGLGTADSLRQHLDRTVGLTPTAYRARSAT